MTVFKYSSHEQDDYSGRKAEHLFSGAVSKILIAAAFGKFRSKLREEKHAKAQLLWNNSSIKESIENTVSAIVSDFDKTTGHHGRDAAAYLQDKWVELSKKHF